MDVTSEEIRSSRFQGTRHVYDRREVDAFLHRAAATLEIYERKLTVTESHVASLEKALELAQSRARSTSALDARVAELEVALAAAQHKHESAVSELELRGEVDSDSSTHDEAEAQRRLEAADALRAEASLAAEEIQNEARATADATVSAARIEAEEILRTALLAQTSILEEVEQKRLDAEARAGTSLDQGANGADADSVTAFTEAEARLDEVAARAGAAEARADRAEEELDRLRSELIGRESKENQGTDTEVAALRRQLAQMRTALANIQTRFAGAAKLSPEELELATALVDLDLHDVDLLVDLTSPAGDHAPANTELIDAEPAPDDVESGVTIKSKWAQAEAVPAGALTEGRAELDPSRRVWPDVDMPTPNWRETFGSARKEAAKQAAEEQREEQSLGFYERRLAGLRDRIKDAGGDTSL